MQLELQDVIAGFETRLRRIKRNGFKTFGSLPEDTMSEDETEDDVETPESPEVTTLPISEDEPNPATPISGGEFTVVGRGKAEVEEAFARAAAVLDGDHSQVSEHAASDGPSASDSNPDIPLVVPPSTSSLHEEL
jgi:hypothetical protein